MTVLRAPVAVATALQTIGGYRIADSKAPNQQFGSSVSAGLTTAGTSLFTLVPASQLITGPTGLVPIIIIPSQIMRAVATSLGFDPANMPGEALELSQECAADFRGCFIAQFQAIGFTPFTPTVLPVPTCN